MPKLRTLLALLLIGSTSAACVDLGDLLGKKEKKSSRDDDDDDDDDKDTKKKKKKAKKDDKKDAKDDAKDDAEKEPGMLGDTGFRPEKHGYAFRNTGGRFPLTPPVVDEKVMVKLFGKSSCVGGDVEDCKLTPAAGEWAFMINRAMNGGQCEGMAVSALTFFKGHDKLDKFMSGATSVHNLQRESVTPLIGYYWAYQAVNPVQTHVYKSRFTATPNNVEDQLLEMWKKGEYATLGFWGPPGQGGHAVTPYAVEDKGGGIHHIKIYDNNYPDTERFIIIDRNANTWKYDVAAINPDVPKMPWSGTAENHSIVVIPLDLRLKKAECPFCKKKKKKKTVVPRSTTITITDDQGRRIGVDGDKEVNEIPDAEVIDLNAFMEGADAASSKIYILPDESEYEIAIAGKDDKAEGDENGVSVFGDGTAFTIAGVKNKKGEKDVLTLGQNEEDVKYKPATGRMPSIKLSLDDDDGGGTQVQIGGLKSDAEDGEFELKLDKKTRKFKLGGGGKSTDSYDLKIRNVSKGEADDVSEEKGIKFKRGESHDVDAKKPPKLAPGAKRTPLRIGKGSFVPKPKAIRKPKPEAPKTEPPKPEGSRPGVQLGPKPGTPPTAAPKPVQPPAIKK
ncbi:MAG: hypothetical protein HOV80_09935 [Polyangiaceae bacterium]|nr:hypothetical protein [Polyangiaceae bacterium]